MWLTVRFTPLFLTMSDISSMIFVIDTPPRGSKLIKVLGQDAPKYYLENLNADSKPWYLRLDYSPSDIMADPDGSVRAGTTKALVQKLTCHEHPGGASGKRKPWHSTCRRCFCASFPHHPAARGLVLSVACTAKGQDQDHKGVEGRMDIDMANSHSPPPST